VQCDGKGDYEVINRNKNSCTRTCTQAHEEAHIADNKRRFGADSCRNKPKGYKPNKMSGYTWTFNWESECRAWSVTKTCLESASRACGCEQDVERALRDARRWVRYYCNTRPPFP
jgi:hypothetical protein